VSGGLRELARAAPDRRRAAAELLPVRVADEIVVDARAEVIRALDAGEDLAEEDLIDLVGGVEAEGGDRTAPVVQLGLEAVRARVEPLDVRIAARPAEAELELQLVL